MPARSVAQGKPEYIYGLHAAAAVLAGRPAQVLELCIKPGKQSSAVAQLVILAEQRSIEVKEVSSSQLRRITHDGVHQGVAVLALLRNDLDDKALEQRLIHSDDNLFLILDEIDDPRNLGACLRVADGAGATGVVVARSRGARITPLAAKVASGAAEFVPCYRVANLARALRLMSAAGVQIIGAAGNSDTTIYDLDAASNIALVIGHEGSGLRRLTRDHCDQLVSIPMNGTVDSLNLSVAAGVMLYEIRRKRGLSAQDDC